MITLTAISMQHGRQILFLEASLQLNPGEKVGLVGPNGSAKSTLFRLIAAEMKGRSVLDEAIAGSGRLGDLHHDLQELEHSDDGEHRPHIHPGSYVDYVAKTGREAPGVHA